MTAKPAAPADPVALAPTEFTELAATEVAPGPGGRTARTAGHAGSALVFVDLWHSFGWFGADTWKAEQSANRWPAITATAMFLIAASHNVSNWWVTRRRARPSTP